MLGILARGRAAFTTHEWRDFLIRSIGLEPNALDERTKMVVLMRNAPFVERNFNLVELGPRGTGKSHHESTKLGEQNVYARAKGLMGDRDPRGHEFSIQPRAMDNDCSGAGLGLPLMVALVGGLLDRNTRGSTIVVGSLHLGGSVEMIPTAVAIAERAVEKQAKVLLVPVSARRGLNDLPDDLAIKILIEFYKDPEDAVLMGLEEYSVASCV